MKKLIRSVRAWLRGLPLWVKIPLMVLTFPLTIAVASTLLIAGMVAFMFAAGWDVLAGEGWFK